MALDPSTDAPAATDGHPQLGSVHKNGDRRFGIAGARSQTLADRGTLMLSSLYHSPRSGSSNSNTGNSLAVLDRQPCSTVTDPPAQLSI